MNVLFFVILQLHLAVPIIFLMFVLFLLIVPLYAAPYDTGMGLVIVLSGVPVYLIGVVWKKKPKAFRRMMSKYFICNICMKLQYS